MRLDPAVGPLETRQRGDIPKSWSAAEMGSPSGVRCASVRAVLFDRDGTLIEDVPYNGVPDRVAPVVGARAALDRLRAAQVRIGVISNQSGVGRGLITEADVAAVNRRVEQLLGPFDVWRICPHVPEDSCVCRKPQPALVIDAAAALGVSPRECVVVGDIGADVTAGAAAGAATVLVPNAVTRAEEIRSAPFVAPTLASAVDWILGIAP